MDFCHGDDWRAQRAKSDRCCVGDQAQARCGERRKAQADQDRRRHGDWRAKTSCPFKECTEGKGYQQQLQAPVFGDAGNRVLQDLEAAVLLGQLMQEDDVQHNPADRQQARQAAKECCIASDASGHAVSKNRNRQCGQQTGTGSYVRLHVQKADANQHHHHRNCAHQGGDGHTAKRVVNLLPEGGLHEISPKVLDGSVSIPHLLRVTARKHLNTSG